MAAITLGGAPCNTIGDLPAVGSAAPAFVLRRNDLSECTLDDFAGQKLILNIFPSINTGICATSTRKFNEEASKLNNTKVLCISRDLPFAQAGFCGAEGIDKVELLSDFATGSFGKDYGLEIVDGNFANLHSRVIVVLNENKKVLYAEQVSEIGHEPNYEAAIAAAN